MPPLVSVVLPAYNCAHYVGEAIESMLAQTFIDFELIVIDDGSKDDTPAVIGRYTDPRLLLVRQENCGLAETLNRGIALSRGRYIARQDADDFSFPTRLEKQVAFLDAHLNCALVGTWAEIWRERTKTNRVHHHPPDSSTLKFELLFDNPFVHSSIMLRKSALDHLGMYCTDLGRQPPEDYELWSRLARVYEVANIPEILHVYREVEGSLSRAGPSPFVENLVTLCAENIAWAANTESGSSAALNIAALTHRAKQRLVGCPDFRKMRYMLRRAVAGVVAPEDCAKFQHTADARIRALRYRYWLLRNNHGWRGRLLQGVRRAVRGLRST
jgi:glycosyltransferase involved in cell wall biosynthesis